MRRLDRVLFLLFLSISGIVGAQKPMRVGTTTANFLEYGYGSAACAMGDAYVSMTGDVSCVYWNPAGLGYLERGEALFSYQPWIVGIKTSFVSVGIPLQRIGAFAFNVISVNYGEMDVTTVSRPEGTGEKFSPSDVAVSISYARKITNWFAFGSSFKYIASNILHMKASAMAVDLGVIINTGFYSVTGRKEDGLNIGMSVSNFGTKMRYDGIDLLRLIDILKDEEGNYANVKGKFALEAWELPVIFRLGISAKPIINRLGEIVLSVDAIHPNNNCEYVNMGVQYSFRFSTTGTLYLRAGYKALFMENSQYSMSYGGGIKLNFLGNREFRINYSFRDIGILGNTSTYEMIISF